MTVLWKWLAPFCALAGLLLTPVTSAQDSDKKAQAREAYARGQQLFRRGDFVGAQTVFEAAYAAVPNPIVLLSVAECQVRTGQFEAAATSLARYLTERPTAPDKSEVKAQIGKLREKPGFVHVTSAPIGAAVNVDGVDTGQTTPADLELRSGQHIVFVDLAGYTRGETVVTVEIAKHHTLEIALTPVPVEVEAVVAAPVPPRVPFSRGPPATAAIWVATGLAGAGLATGALLGGLALKERSDFNKHPTEAGADKGERLALFADVAFGLAVAGAVTGIVLYLTRDDAPGEQAFRVAPSLAGGGAGLVGNLRF